MKMISWLVGVAIVVVGCGGGDEDSDSKANDNPADTPLPSPSEGVGGDPNMQPGGIEGGEQGGVKFLVKKDDGLFYAAKQVSDNPFTGKIEGQDPGGLKVSETIYEQGMPKSRTEWYEGGNQKKLVITYDERGREGQKEEWREDGTKVSAASKVKLPAPNPKSLGRTLVWTMSGLEIYNMKPTSTVLKVFGGPNEHQVEQTATTYQETWIYEGIKVKGGDGNVSSRKMTLTVDRNKKVTYVEVEMDLGF